MRNSMWVGRSFVGNTDIGNFFGSIRSEAVVRHLESHEFHDYEANLIARLCTKDDRLPQGAPTSPVISNSILYKMDKQMTAFCNRRSLKYSRYADDITVSGGARLPVANSIR